MENHDIPNYYPDWTDPRQAAFEVQENTIKMTHKSFVSLNDRLVSVSVEYVYPPIPMRTRDYRAWYTDDQSDSPDCGWGASAEAAIDDLVDSYDAPGEREAE